MTPQSFSLSNLNDLFTHLSVVNVTDPIPAEAIVFLFSEHIDSLSVSGIELIREMLNAISANTIEAFQQKYCEAPFLIVSLDDESVCKTALQNELVFIMNVRQYKKLPTVLLSKNRLADYPLTNESLITYTRVHCSIRK